ncbi:hypothetical protein GCM10023238_01680 [Streptomyces heliomycini]
MERIRIYSLLPCRSVVASCRCSFRREGEGEWATTSAEGGGDVLEVGVGGCDAAQQAGEGDPVQGTSGAVRGAGGLWSRWSGGLCGCVRQVVVQSPPTGRGTGWGRVTAEALLFLAAGARWVRRVVAVDVLEDHGDGLAGAQAARVM